MHFERGNEMPFKMPKTIFFPSKKMKPKCAYTTYNFQTHYPKHTYFSFGLNIEKCYYHDPLLMFLHHWALL